MALKFEILKKSGKSRLGKLHTKHGTIDTPAFMPVGTCGTVKAMMPESVAATGAQILLGNTYHLMLRPGADLVEKMGGLHKFMNWDKPILTDSGGFQVMSLSGLRKLTEEGVAFNSHVDGKKYFLSPEESIKIQHKLDSNITMCMDECVKLPATHDVVKKSMEMSMRWAKRSRDAFTDRDGYGIFGIQQGGDYEDLRAYSAEKLKEIGFDGYAIGGLAVGEGQETMFKVLDYAPGMLPEDKPRYLMGVGRPDDIVGAVLICLTVSCPPVRDALLKPLPASGRLISAMLAIGKITARWKKAAIALCAPITPALIYIICKSVMKCLPLCCSHGTISAITSG